MIWKFHKVLFIKEQFAIFFLPKRHSTSTKLKNWWITKNLLIICLKCISEERFLRNVSAKIINASLKCLIKVATQKAKFYKYIYINQIYQTNFKSFSNQRSDTVSISSSVNSSLSFFSFCISFFLHETYFYV